MIFIVIIIIIIIIIIKSGLSFTIDDPSWN